jgi:hypothetical protein
VSNLEVYQKKPNLLNKAHGKSNWNIGGAGRNSSMIQTNSPPKESNYVSYASLETPAMNLQGTHFSLGYNKLKY